MGLLGTQVQWCVLKLGIMLTESPLGCLVENSQHTSNVLAHHLDFGQLGCSAASNLGDTQVGELSLKVIQLLGQVRLCLGLLADQGGAEGGETEQTEEEIRQKIIANITAPETKKKKKKKKR